MFTVRTQNFLGTDVNGPFRLGEIRVVFFPSKWHSRTLRQSASNTPGPHAVYLRNSHKCSCMIFLKVPYNSGQIANISGKNVIGKSRQIHRNDDLNDCSEHYWPDDCLLLWHRVHEPSTVRRLTRADNEVISLLVVITRCTYLWREHVTKR